MAKDASGWEAASDYDYLDTLGASDLAWEWLRRNERYEHDFAVFDHATADPGDARNLIRERWGLRFPDTAVPASAGRPRLLAGRRRHQLDLADRRSARHRGCNAAT